MSLLAFVSRFPVGSSARIKIGNTIIIITHEIDIAAYAKRIIFFSDGNIIEDKRLESRREIMKIVENVGGVQ